MGQNHTRRRKFTEATVVECKKRRNVDILGNSGRRTSRHAPQRITIHETLGQSDEDVVEDDDEERVTDVTIVEQERRE